MERKTNEFTARSEDGQEYIIYEYTNVIDAPNLNDPSAAIRGLKRLCTSEGEDVNFKSEGVYEIVFSGLILIKTNS